MRRRCQGHVDGDREAPAVRDLLQQCWKRRFTRGRDVETALLEIMGLQCGDELARAEHALVERPALAPERQRRHELTAEQSEVHSVGVHPHSQGRQFRVRSDAGDTGAKFKIQCLTPCPPML